MLNTWEGVRTGPGSSQVLNNMSVTISVPPPGQHTRTPTHIQTHHMHTHPLVHIYTQTYIPIHIPIHTLVQTHHMHTQPTCTHIHTSTQIYCKLVCAQSTCSTYSKRGEKIKIVKWNLSPYSNNGPGHLNSLISNLNKMLIML